MQARLPEKATEGQRQPVSPRDHQPHPLLGILLSIRTRLDLLLLLLSIIAVLIVIGLGLLLGVQGSIQARWPRP